MAFPPSSCITCKKCPNQYIYLFFRSSRKFPSGLIFHVPSCSLKHIFFLFFFLLEIGGYNENTDTTSTMEVLAGPSAINNVGNILLSKAITGSAILKIASPWRVGIRFLWQEQKTHDSWMPGGRNELQEPGESHIIAHYRLNRFCLFAGERMEKWSQGISASLGFDQQGWRGWTLGSSMYGFRECCCRQA